MMELEEDFMIAAKQLCVVKPVNDSYSISPHSRKLPSINQFVMSPTV